MSKPAKVSKGGSPILRHTEGKDLKLARGNEQNIEAISKHIERHLGDYPTVFHEIVSHLVHIDLHIVPPSKKRPFYSVVTSGMSDQPMTVPDGAEEFRYAELMLCLPPDWPMDRKDWKKKKNYWPIEQLKFLARMPHEYDTRLGFGHTIPNGDPPEFFGDTKFCCVLIGPPVTAPERFWKLKLGKDKTINFLGVFFLYPEEMELKMNQGMDALAEALDDGGVNELLEVNRKNAARKASRKR